MSTEEEAQHIHLTEAVTPQFIIRVVFGGVLMGIANIIPGVSGGTMILAAGLYEDFVNSVASLTRLKFTYRSIVFLGVMGVAAFVAILFSAGIINWGLTNHQHVMFGLFIGLTLGGVPLLLKELNPIPARSIVSAVAGLALIITTTYALQNMNLPANFMLLFIGGIIGSAAMVLPGISGSYILLAMGLYYPITEGISAFKDGLQALDVQAMMGPAFGIMLPVGLGVLAGIAGLSNLLKWALSNAYQTTMGLLLGLMLGSVFFLYPFKEPGRKDPFEAAADLTPMNILIVAVALVIGFALTFSFDKFGNAPKDEAAEH